MYRETLEKYFGKIALSRIYTSDLLEVSFKICFNGNQDVVRFHKTFLEENHLESILKTLTIFRDSNTPNVKSYYGDINIGDINISIEEDKDNPKNVYVYVNTQKENYKNLFHSVAFLQEFLRILKQSK